jgi:hypothetical protein
VQGTWRSHPFYKCILSTYCVIFTHLTDMCSVPVKSQVHTGWGPYRGGQVGHVCCLPRVFTLGGWNPGPRACWTSALPLSSTPVPGYLFLSEFENLCLLRTMCISCKSLNLSYRVVSLSFFLWDSIVIPSFVSDICNVCLLKFFPWP